MTYLTASCNKVDPVKASAPPSMTMTLSVVSVGLQYPSSLATAAKLHRQSSSATALDAADRVGLNDSNLLISSVQMLVCSSQVHREGLAVVAMLQ